MSTGQLVTCLMVTMAGPQRFARFQRSVADYCRQTYAPRELLIVTNGGLEQDHAALAAFVASLGRDDIRVVRLPDDATLGRLRNESIANARGNILCQWDDDDWFHPERLIRQHEALVKSGRSAVLLQEVMQFYPHLNTLYCTNWRATEAKGHPGTIMFARDAALEYPEHGDTSIRGEDLAVAMQLHERDGVALLADAPHLFIYNSHGANTWPDDHHQMLSNRLAISQGLLRRREAQLRAGLQAFDFGAGPIVVQGNNGPAFTIGEAS